MMRKNLATVDDQAAASRAASISGLQRMKQEQEKMERLPTPDKVDPPDEPTVVLLTDELGGKWVLSITSKGVIGAAPYQGKQNGPPTKF